MSIRLAIVLSIWPQILLAADQLNTDSSSIKKTNSYIAGVTSQSLKSLRLPETINKKLESIYIEQFKTSYPDLASELSDAEIRMKLKRKGLITQVRLEPLDDLVLPGKVRYDMPLGGGEILLNENVRGRFPGRFKVYLDVRPAVNSDAIQKAFDQSLQVYFLSQAKAREVKGKKVGSGCNVFLDLTRHYKAQVEKNGITVDVMNGAHASTLVGYFIFAFAFEDHLHLGVIKFHDNDFSQYLCN